MGELTITTFLTLDGTMQAPGGPEEDTSGGFRYGGWLGPFFDDDTGRIIDENWTRVSAFLLGRATYDIFYPYWSRITDPNDLIAGKLNALPKFVASRTRSSFEWQGTTGIQDVVREVPALKERFPGELQVHGSGNLAQTLIEHGLIDEYRLFTFPVLVGPGKRLFGAGVPPTSLQLVSCRTTGSGVVYSVYRRGGEFRQMTVGE